jgi:outer membrane protein assembly factor BamB
MNTIHKNRQGKKALWAIVPVFLCSLFSCFSCDLFFGQEKTGDGGPVYPKYTAKVVWRSDTKMVKYSQGVQEGRYLYVYEDASVRSSADNNYNFRLKKIDLENGKIVWQSPDFPILLCAPAIIEDTIYVAAWEHLIYCFDKNNGRQLAILQTNVQDESLMMNSNLTPLGAYLYFGVDDKDHSYFARIDTRNISFEHGRGRADPEILWTSKYDRRVLANPVIKDNTIYFITDTWNTRFSVDPSELVGIDVGTTETVWSLETWEDDGRGTLLIHDETIYLLGENVVAYNLTTGEKLFARIFPQDMTDENYYAPRDSYGSVYYEGRLYYTNANFNIRGSPKFKAPNIVCLEAQDGSTVWTDLPYNSSSLGLVPFVYNNRVFLPLDDGLRVYKADTGEVLGVDTTISTPGYNTTIFQYKNLMIFPDYISHPGAYSYIAIDLNG